MIKKEINGKSVYFSTLFLGQEVIHDDQVKVMIKVDLFIQAYLFKKYKLLNPS